MAKIYKRCTCCTYVWENPTQLILDEKVHVIGYQPSFKNGIEGMFFFSHNEKGCGTTIAVPASDFTALYDGPEYTSHLVGTTQCKGLCESFYDFGECANPCAMRWIREILKIMKNRGPEELLVRLDTEDLLQHSA